MVIHQSRVELGNGDIQIRCSYIEGKGVLVIDDQEPGTIGSRNIPPNAFIPAKELSQVPLILSFANKASIDAFKTALDMIRIHTTD